MMDNVIKGLLAAGAYLRIVVPCVVLSVIAANIVQNFNLFGKLCWLSNPIMKLANLSAACGLSFLTAFASPGAANAMLRDAFDKGMVPRRELFVAVCVNAFPAIVVMELHYLLPLVLSLLGKYGLLFFIIMIFLNLMETLVAVVIGHIMLPKKSYNASTAHAEPVPALSWGLIKKSLMDALPTLRKILMITVPVTVITFLLLYNGFFEIIETYVKKAGHLFPIPPDGLGIVGAYLGHYMAGYTMAGNMLASGALGVKTVFLALLIAHMLQGVLFLVRHSIPYYVGFYGTALGVRIAVLATAIRLVVNMAAVMVLCKID